MREPSLLRTLALPLGAAVVMLFVIPKACGGLMQKGIKNIAQQKKAGATNSGVGLTIESSTPDPNAQHDMTFPAGLDESRVQYLVEIAPQFSEPRRLRVPKVVLSEDLYPLVPVVKKLGYFETQPDGTLAPTREASLHLTDMREDSNGWSIPVAQRKFVQVTNVGNQGGMTKVTFRWKWEPAEIGRAMEPVITTHDGDVILSGSGASWAVESFARLEQDW